MIIPNGKWSKQHVMEGIVKVCDTPRMFTKARELDAYEWGVYRGGSI